MAEERGYSYISLSDALYRAGIGDVETCRYEASVLLSHFSEISRAMLLSRKTELFYSEALEVAVRKRLNRYPLQYLIGEWQFCNETYTVTPDCLIPRMDTEILVEAARDTLRPNGNFIDLCTGSGCIAISLLAARKDATGVAVELYPSTLRVAEGNAARNHVEERITFLHGDVLKPDFMESLGSFDLILSNPPYIPSDVVDGLSEEVKKEPRAALDGGADGLIFYRTLVREYPRYLKEGGKMILEIGYDQGEAITLLARGAGLSAEIRKDLSGNDRIAILSR